MNEQMDDEAARSLTALADGRRASMPRPRFAYGTRLVLPALLLIGFVSVAAWAARGSLVPAAEVRVVPVVVREVEGRQTVDVGDRGSTRGEVVAQASGWVEPDPYPIIVNALADGVVREVLVLEGDAVEADHPVARLIDDDAELSLRLSEAALAGAQARLEAARVDWENPVEHERAVATAKADVAATEADLSEARATVEAEVARTKEMEYRWERIEATDSAVKGSVSEFEIESARQQLAAMRAVVEAATKKVAALEARLEGNRADLVAAAEDARLRTAEARTLAAAEAEVAGAMAGRDEAALRLGRMTVRSPARGVVMTRHVNVGSKVMLGMEGPLSATVVRLFDPRKLQARVDVPLADAAKIGVGMPAEVIVSALPDTTFAGEVTRIVNEADVTRNTLQVKVAIDDPDPRLKPEMLARVKFFAIAGADQSVTPTSDRVVFAPGSLVGDGSAWVVVDGVAERRDVTLGEAREGGWIEVASGLMPGDRIVADPADLQVGDRIRVVGEAEGGTDGLR